MYKSNKSNVNDEVGYERTIYAFHSIISNHLFKKRSSLELNFHVISLPTVGYWLQFVFDGWQCDTDREIGSKEENKYWKNRQVLQGKSTLILLAIYYI